MSPNRPGQDEATPSFLGMPAVIVSETMQSLMRQVRRIAQTNAAVLIRGESGTGKELVARALHEFSSRRSQPWIDVNCAALPDHLIESELFGYEKGAFSGAETAKPGMFELANGGTLFLDEVGELEFSKQTKLLRPLDGYPHYRLGGTRKIQVDVRLVAATNGDLEAAIRAGKFRSEFYHRLNQATITVPPLRDRRADILPLAAFFLARQSPDTALSEAAAEALLGYSWPGNVRELRNVMAKSATATQGSLIGLEDLPPEILAGVGGPNTAETHSLDRLEEHVIFSALSEADGRRDRAAAMLGISTRTLARRLKVYGERATLPPGGSLLCN